MKFAEIIEPAAEIFVLPLAREWIEIIIWMGGNKFIVVLPLAREWIEISL